MWNNEEIAYLEQLNKLCQTQSQRYKEVYDRYRSLQAKLKIPVIIMSSLAGVASFGTQTFPEDGQRWVSIIVGGVNIIISIMNAIEAYYTYQQIIEKALKTCSELKKLSDEITLELSLPPSERETTGVLLCRKAYGEYESIMQNAPPVLRRQRFVKPSMPLLEIQSATSDESGQQYNKILL
jgi:hypothetical protein